MEGGKGRGGGGSKNKEGGWVIRGRGGGRQKYRKGGGNKRRGGVTPKGGQGFKDVCLRPKARSCACPIHGLGLSVYGVAVGG